MTAPSVVLLGALAGWVDEAQVTLARANLPVGYVTIPAPVLAAIRSELQACRVDAPLGCGHWWPGPSDVPGRDRLAACCQPGDHARCPQCGTLQAVTGTAATHTLRAAS